MANKLGLYNAALALLKERKLSALTDNVRARHQLDLVYDDVMAYMLEQGYWNFAQRSVMIEPDPNVDPAFGYTYAFEHPSDMVRLVKISANDSFFPTLDPYLDEGGHFYAHAGQIYVMYVSNGASYGGDLSLWPATFAYAAAHELARRAGPHIATLGRADQDRLDRDSGRTLRDARAKDASRQPVDRLQPGRLVQARSGRRTRGTGIWDF